MTSFSIGELSIALALGLLVGTFCVTGTKSQLYKAGPAALAALQQSMGSLLSIGVFLAGALPVAAMHLVSSLRRAPTVFDTLVIIGLVGVGLVAALILLGNVIKVLGEHMSANRPG